MAKLSEKRYKEESAIDLLKRGWFHLISSFVIVPLLFVIYSVKLAIVITIIVTIALSYFSRDSRLTPRKIIEGFIKGGVDMLAVTPALAAIAMISIPLLSTGLALKVGNMLLSMFPNNVFFLCLFALLFLKFVGLAVPITATYILGVVVLSYPFSSLGFPTYAIHLLCFYFAICSELSPPVSINAIVASSVTGGNANKIMLEMYRYALPSLFIVFSIFVNPNGMGFYHSGWMEIDAMDENPIYCCNIACWPDLYVIGYWWVVFQGYFQDFTNLFCSRGLYVFDSPRFHFNLCRCDISNNRRSRLFS